jgi:hypothetical protein
MGGKKSRDRGSRFERVCADVMTGLSGVRWARTKIGDVDTFGDILPMAPVGGIWGHLFIECKDHSDIGAGNALLWPSAKVRGIWQKAVAQAAEVERVPLLMCKLSPGRSVVLGDADVLLPLAVEPMFTVVLNPGAFGRNVVAVDLDRLERRVGGGSLRRVPEKPPSMPGG